MLLRMCLRLSPRCKSPHQDGLCGLTTQHQNVVPALTAHVLQDVGHWLKVNWKQNAFIYLFIYLFIRCFKPKPLTVQMHIFISVEYNSWRPADKNKSLVYFMSQQIIHYIISNAILRCVAIAFLGRGVNGYEGA